ncbi:MAG TPA: YegS/Rv2252/BmrU family lipid kinase [Acidimicrobiia bacterium]|nr:YegS/Rv2252/BmrU family lipid kinase [Acidimicrobiia bacterium]
MTSVAVIAHSGKSLGGGLPELRSILDMSGVTDPMWFEVPKSKKAPKRVRKALADGADLVFVWGGDGMVQQCIDVLAGSDAILAIIPAGTANLFATNLGIPKDLTAAVELGLHGDRRKFDVGVINGEHFAVMAGAGFDAVMIRDADGEMKDRFGRVAYLWTGAKHLRAKRVGTRVRVDGDTWFDGDTSCVLVGNVGKVMGDIAAFPDAHPDDGVLEVGIVTARGAWQWARTLAHMARGRAKSSPFVRTTRGKAIDVRFSKKVTYELDGGDRKPRARLRIKVKPSAITVCVPAPGA